MSRPSGLSNQPTPDKEENIMAGSLWTGTFLAEVEEIAAAGKFTEPDGAIAEGEEVIGEMTIGEKALYAFCETTRAQLAEDRPRVAVLDQWRPTPDVEQSSTSGVE